MSLRIASTMIATVIGICLAPATRAQGIDPCSVHICMAGISGYGASGGLACAPATHFFFDTLVVWDWSGFDMPATWALRYMYMNYCPGVVTAPTNQAISASIAYTWYTVP